MNQLFFVAVYMVLLVCCSTYTLAFNYELYDDTAVRECNAVKCLNIDEVVKRVKTQNYKTREKLQSLIQTRHMTKVKLARIFPSFNLSLGVSAALFDMTALPNLFGFLFPSNWFSWKESKLFYLAEKESYLNIIANQIASGKELYFILHREMVEADIFKHHYKIMDNIIRFFKKKKRLDQGVSDYEISRIETIDSQAKIKALILQNEFKDSLPLLGHLIALPIENDWDHSSIKFLTLPHLNNYPKKDAVSKYKEVLQSSYLLRSMKVLLVASHYAKKKRTFEFFSPNASQDGSLGYGYSSRIEISKSNKKSIEIKIEELQSSLKIAIHAFILDYNTSIDTYIQSIKGRKASYIQLKTIFDRYEKTKTIDFEELSEALQSGLTFDLERNNAQHYYYISKVKIDRLLLKGKAYENLEKYVPHNKKLSIIQNWYEKKEDRLITKEEKKGGLIINEIY